MGEKEIKRAEFSGQWVVDEREEGMKKMPSKRAISRKRGGGGGGCYTCRGEEREFCNSNPVRKHRKQFSQEERVSERGKKKAAHVRQMEMER